MKGPGSDPPWAAKEPEAEDVEPDVPSEPPPPADPVTDPQPETKRRKKKNYVEAVHRSMLEGQSESLIRAWLEKKGLAKERIDRTIERARARIEERVEQQLEDDAAANREEKRKHLIAGAGWFGVGLVLTVVTYSSASEGGGHYVLAWGPMVYGVIRLMRGL